MRIEDTKEALAELLARLQKEKDAKRATQQFVDGLAQIIETAITSSRVSVDGTDYPVR